jgi:hypothetical protein
MYFSGTVTLIARHWLFSWACSHVAHRAASIEAPQYQVYETLCEVASFRGVPFAFVGRVGARVIDHAAADGVQKQTDRSI